MKLKQEFRRTSLLTVYLPSCLPAIIAGVGYGLLSWARFDRMWAGIDLAIFTQAAKQYSEWQAPWSTIKSVSPFNLLGDHFSPVIALLGPVYALVPHTWVLLLVQALLIALATFILTHTAVRKLGPVLGMLVGLIFAASWGIQGLALFDFHEVAFALPLLAAAYCALLDNRNGRAVLWSLPLMLVKEDSVFLLLGLVLVLLTRRQWKLASILAAYAVGSFALIVWVIIPRIGFYGRYTYWEASAASGVNPIVDAFHNAVTSVTSGATPMLFVVLFAGTLGVGFRSPLILGVLPNLLSRLTSPNPTYLNGDLQYNGTVAVIIAIAFVDGVLRYERKPQPDKIPSAVKIDSRPATITRQQAVTFAIIASTVVTFAITVFLAPAGLLARTLAPPSEDYKTVAESLTLIPHNSRVIASDTIAAYLVDRTRLFILEKELTNSASPEKGFTDSTGQIINADYVVIDRRTAEKWQKVWISSLIISNPQKILTEISDQTVPLSYDIIVIKL